MASNHKATAVTTMKFISRKCLLSSFAGPCRCTSSTQALKNCEETNSRGSDRTEIAWLEDERKKEKEEEENRPGKQAFRPITERLIGKGLESSEGTSSIAQ